MDGTSGCGWGVPHDTWYMLKRTLKACVSYRIPCSSRVHVQLHAPVLLPVKQRQTPVSEMEPLVPTCCWEEEPENQTGSEMLQSC